MKKYMIIMLMLLLPANVLGLEVAGVKVSEAVTIDGRSLQLNGCGVRKKFFIKVYVGALYTGSPVSSLAEAQRAAGGKLIRMTFLYKKVDREKVVGAFAEGFADNAPEVLETKPAREFLSLFTKDFSRGDVLDLEIGRSGAVKVRRNDKVLGTILSPPLAEGVLAIYLGSDPADENLKRGMLGL